MRNIKTAFTDNEKRADVPLSAGTGRKGENSKYVIVRSIAESAIVGFLLYLAFLIQNSWLNLDNRQFFIGHGELMRMSLSISFCYAFILVLRRGYRQGVDKSGMGLIKRPGQYVFETHVLYMALLFLVRDIDFASIKLSLGINLVLSAFSLALFNLALLSVKKGEKALPEHRKIILKKQPLSHDPNVTPPARHRVGADANKPVFKSAGIGGLLDENHINDFSGDPDSPSRLAGRE